MKQHADIGRSDHEFSVGDFVYVKLQPYIQGSVAVRACHKLSFKYFGPFKIVARISKVAYKLSFRLCHGASSVSCLTAQAMHTDTQTGKPCFANY
jgi:hypothetical protein